MIQTYLDQALSYGQQFIYQGNVASYIPELANADTRQNGICILCKNGNCYASGDSETYFTIQSISKVLNLAIALQTYGYKEVFGKVKLEPSGDAFNSIIKLDTDSHIPFNPMINSGAIVIVDFLQPRYTFEEILAFAKKLCMDDNLSLDENVYHSELSTGSRNRSIAYLLHSKGLIHDNVEEVIDLYFKLCSIRVSAKSLAGFGLILANDGINPFTGEVLLEKGIAKVVKTLMLTCGLYDGSGEFAVKVGIPAKSGVGGGILSFVNHEAGIGVFGPSLDPKGNSIAGIHMLEHLSHHLHLHILDNDPLFSTLINKKEIDRQ